MPTLMESLPDWVKASPSVVILLAVILALLTGQLVTGRTFNRELGQCREETTLYKGIAFNAVRLLHSEARAAGRNSRPLPDAEPATLAEELDADEQVLQKKKNPPGSR